MFYVAQVQSVPAFETREEAEEWLEEYLSLAEIKPKGFYSIVEIDEEDE